MKSSSHTKPASPVTGANSFAQVASHRKPAAIDEQPDDLYRMFFEAANDGLFVLRLSPDGSAGKFLEVNDRACQMLGYSKEELLALTPEKVDAEDQASRLAHRKKLFSDKRTTTERLLTAKGGAKIPVEISTHLFELQGQPAALAVIRDIRERKRAEDLLRLSEERFRTMVHELQVAVMVAGPTRELQYMNPAALAIVGRSEEEVLGKTPEDLGLTMVDENGLDLPLALRPGPRVVKSGGPVRNETIGVRIHGSDKVTWLYGCVLPQFTQDGSMKQIIGAFADITQRKESEAALHKASELNRQILFSVQEGIIVHDRQLRYTLWNPFMERISGMPAKDVLGRHPTELFPFLKEEGVFAQLERALAGEVTSARDIPYTVPQTGETGWSHNNFAPLRNEKGEITGVIATVRDVTKRKHAEDELHELSSRLLQLQDEERRRIARDLHDSVAQSVLAVSLNLAQLSKSGSSLDKQGHHALSEARKLVKALAREIRSLSYLLHPPELDALGLASAIEEYAKGFSQRTAIRVDLELAGDLGRLPQDAETALFRILQESLGNIQKHSGSSSGLIRLAKHRSEVTLEVSDQGSGITSDILSEQRMGPVALGVGILGMRERMRQLGGRLEISSGSWGTKVQAVLPMRGKGENGTAHPHSG